MKITIIGPSSGGKSTLARKISDSLGIKRLELDRLWFGAGGHDCFIKGCDEKEKNLVTEKIRIGVMEFLAQNDSWVIDGTYNKIQPTIADRADIVILIKRPIWRRVASHILRIIKDEWRHSETSRLQDYIFSKTIIQRWLSGENKKIENMAMNYSDKLVRLESFEEINKYYDVLIKNSNLAK